ncbi:hypothetical protein ABQF35_21070 [Mycobacterium syngnathidarum]
MQGAPLTNYSPCCRTDVEIVGAADRNPAVIGTDLSALVGAGFESCVTTVAAAVDAVAVVIDAPSGFLSMGDLPARVLASKDARLGAEGVQHAPPPRSIG